MNQAGRSWEDLRCSPDADEGARAPSLRQLFYTLDLVGFDCLLTDRTNRINNPHRFHRRLHIMNAHDMRTIHHRSGNGGDRPVKAFIRGRVIQQLSDKRFA